MRLVSGKRETSSAISLRFITYGMFPSPEHSGLIFALF